MYVSPRSGDLYIGRGGGILRLRHNSRNLELFAGNPEQPGHVDGSLSKATFSAPGGMVFLDDLERSLIVCDRSAHRIRCIGGDQVVTYAGTGKKGRKDGLRTDSEWSWPNDVIRFRGSLYVADYGNNLIRVISPQGLVSSIGNGAEKSVDGLIGSAEVSFKCPFGICVAKEIIYVTDQLSHCVRAINLDKQEVTTLCGGGPGGAGIGGGASERVPKQEDGAEALNIARFHYPKGIDCTPDGDLIVADYNNACIRLISTTQSLVTVAVAQHETDRKKTETTTTPSKSTSSSSPSSSTSITDKLSTPSEPYFLALSPFGHLFWTTGSEHNLHCCLHFTRPFSDDNWSKTPIFSTLCDFPSLCDIHLSFTSESSTSSTGFASSSSSTSSLIPSPSHSSHPTLHIQSQLLRNIHPNLATQSFLENARKVTQPYRFAEFISMLLDMYPISSPEWCAYSAYVFDLAGLDHNWSPLMLWALQSFRLSLHTSLPSLFTLFLDIVHNMGGHAELIQILAGHIRPLVAKEEELEPLLQTLAPYAASNPPIHAFVVECLVGKDFQGISLPNPQQEGTSVTKPSKALQDGMESLASSLRFITTASSNSSPAEQTPYPSDSSVAKQPPGTMPGNYKVTIEGLVDEASQLQPYILVHDWLLHQKWPYFARAISVGMLEASNRTLELPAEFPSNLLLAFVEFLYTGKDFRPLASVEDVMYLLSNGAQFGILQLNGEPEAAFQPFVQACRTQFIRPLSKHTALKQLQLGIELGNEALLNEAARYTARHIRDIVTGEVEHALIMSLPEHVRSQLLDQFLRSLY